MCNKCNLIFLFFLMVVLLFIPSVFAQPLPWPDYPEVHGVIEMDHNIHVETDSWPITITFFDNACLQMNGYSIEFIGNSLYGINVVQAEGTSGGFIMMKDSDPRNVTNGTFQYCTFWGLGANPSTPNAVEEGNAVIKVKMSRSEANPPTTPQLTFNHCTFNSCPSHGISVIQQHPTGTTTLRSINISFLHSYMSGSGADPLFSGFYIRADDGLATDPAFSIGLSCSIEMEQSHIDNFGYGQPVRNEIYSTDRPFGSAIERIGAGTQEIAIRNGDYVSNEVLTMPVIQNCGNGISCRGDKLKASINIQPGNPRATTTFSDLSGSGIWVDAGWIGSLGFAADGITAYNLSLFNTGLDGIRVGTEFVTTTTDYRFLSPGGHEGRMYLEDCSISQIGSLQTGDNDEHFEANGIYCYRGSIECDVVNSRIEYVYSNGIKFYTEVFPAGRPASWWKAPTYSNLSFRRKITDNSVVLDPAVEPTIYPWAVIQQCGYRFTPANPPIYDQNHGIRTGSYPWVNELNQPVFKTFGRLHCYDAAIMQNSGSGVAMRGQGFSYYINPNTGEISHNTYPTENAKYYGSIELNGCATDNNEQHGIHIKGIDNSVFVHSQARIQQTDNFRNLHAFIRNNLGKGILLDTMFVYQPNYAIPNNNRILVGGALDSVPVEIRHNQGGGIIAEEFGDGDLGEFGFYQNGFYVFGGVKIQGILTTNQHEPAEYGFALNSEFADRNQAKILPSGSYIGIELPKHPTQTYSFMGRVQIYDHTRDGVMSKGRGNLFYIEAEISGNYWNGLRFEERPDSNQNREDGAGYHEINMGNCLVDGNGLNGMYVVSRTDCSVNPMFGYSYLIVNVCTFSHNNRLLTNDARAGVWMCQNGGRFEGNGNAFYGTPQRNGLLESGVANDYLIMGGAFYDQLYGFHIDENASDVQLAMDNNFFQSVLYYPATYQGTPSKVNVGPEFYNNSIRGIQVDAQSCENPLPHALYLKLATFRDNPQGGVECNAMLSSMRTRPPIPRFPYWLQLDPMPHTGNSLINNCRFVNNSSTTYPNSANLKLNTSLGYRNLYVSFNEFVGAGYGIQINAPYKTIQNNVIDNPSICGISISEVLASDSKVIQNTVLCNQTGATGLHFERLQPFTGLTTVYGNISVVSPNNPSQPNAYEFNPDNPTGFDFSYCLAWDGTRPWTELVLPRTISPETHRTGNPRVFINSSELLEKYKYHLLWNSDAINAGSVVDPSSRDADGTRGDLGAFSGNFVPSFPDPTNSELLYPPIPNPLISENKRSHWRAGNVLLIADNNPNQVIEITSNLKSGTYQAANSWRVPANASITIEGDFVDYQPQRSNITFSGVVNMIEDAPSCFEGVNGYRMAVVNPGIHRFTGGQWGKNVYQHDRLNRYGGREGERLTYAAFEPSNWQTMIFDGNGNLAQLPIVHLLVEKITSGVSILGPTNQLGYGLSFNDVEIIPENWLRIPNEDYGYALHIRNREAAFNGLVIHQYQNSEPVPFFGIWMSENTNREPPWQDTKVSISNLTFNYQFNNYNRYIYCQNLLSCVQGNPNPLPNDDRNSFILSNAQITPREGHSPQIDPRMGWVSNSGIRIENSTFMMDNVEIQGIEQGNALELSQIANLYPLCNTISNSTFARSTTTDENGSRTHDGNGVVCYSNSYPTFIQCQIYRNASYGLFSQMGSHPAFVNTSLQNLGSEVYDNFENAENGRELLKAQVFHAATLSTEAAPMFDNNSIYTTFNEVRENPLIRRMNYSDDNPTASFYNAVFWNQLDPNTPPMMDPRSDTTNLHKRMYYVRDVDESRAMLPEPPDPNTHDRTMYSNPLPCIPGSGFYGYRTIDGIGKLQNGDYPGAAQCFYDAIYNEELPLHIRSHSVPLYFVANKYRGISYKDNLAIQETMEKDFSGTDMFPAVRNYGPLLCLLNDDPDKAMEKYEQFRIAPLSLEDSLSAIYALAILDPVMGPESELFSVTSELAAMSRHVNRVDEVMHTINEARRTQSQPPSEGHLVTIPATFALNSVYPNPFNSTLHIRFDVPKNDRVSIILYDAQGRQAEVLHEGNLTAGSHEISWHADRMASGVYFVSMKAPGFVATKKAVLLK